MDKQLEDTRKKMIQVLADTLKLVRSKDFDGGVIMVNICRKDGGSLNGGVIGAQVDDDIVIPQMLGMINHIKGEMNNDNRSLLN